MTIHLTDEQEQDLIAIAASSSQSVETVASEILSWAFKDRLALTKELAEAREDVASGLVLTTEQALQHASKLSDAA